MLVTSKPRSLIDGDDCGSDLPLVGGAPSVIRADVSAEGFFVQTIYT